MKQNVLFFGVAYALSIGSVLLLGGRKDVFSKADVPSQEEIDTAGMAISSEYETVAATNESFAPDCKPDFPTLTHPRLAMTQKRQSLEFFQDSEKDTLPSAISLSNPLPKIQSDVVDVTIALSDAFDIDEDISQIGKPAKPVPVPVEISEDDLSSLAPSVPEGDNAAKLAELRETIAALTKTKAELLNAKALEGEVSRLQKEIANLQAARRLLDARQVLEKLIQEFPDSPAADRAKSMLKALPTPKTPQDQLAPNPHFSPFQSGA